MQKALAELERLGLVYSQRTSGRFITDNTLLLKNLRYQSAQQEMTNYIEHMQKLGFNSQQAVDLLLDYLQNDKVIDKLAD